MSYKLKKKEENEDIKTWIRNDGTISSWVNYDEINRIINDIKYGTEDTKEQACYRWVQFVENSPKIVTENQTKKLIDALKTYQ